MAIDLRNVTIELLHEHKVSMEPAVSLARLDFITSKLSFVGYSDQTKDIDLVSQEIRVTDTRDDQSSAFKQILQVHSLRLDLTVNILYVETFRFDGPYLSHV